MNNDELRKAFLYPNGTLRNKLNIQDPDKLSSVEFRMVAHHASWLLDHGYQVRNMDDFPKIHQFLFGELYSWAGQLRTYYISKGGTTFMPPTAFDMALTNINGQLDELVKEKQPTAFQYAKLLDSLNYLHPFREGNGRTTRLFLQLLAANHGQYLDLGHQDANVLQALNNSELTVIQQFIHVKDLN